MLLKNVEAPLLKFFEICPNFWQIETFWGKLAPTEPLVPTPLSEILRDADTCNI